MGGRFWVGLLLLLLPLGAAAAVAEELPPSVAPAAAEDEPEAVTVLSGDTVTFRTTSDLADTWTGRATPARGTVLLAGECADDVAVVRVAGTAQSSVAAAPTTVGSTCLVALEADGVALTDPATGHLVIAVAGSQDAAVAYDVTRTTGFDVYATVAAISLLCGAVGAFLLKSGVQNRTIPDNWSFKDGWASSLTGLTVAAAALFELTGVLDEYAPQYSVAGVLAANLVVAVLVLLAPVAFSSFGGSSSEQSDRRRGFWVAGAISLTAAAAQLCLIGLVIVSGSTIGAARIVVGILVLVALGLIVWRGRHAATHVTEDIGSASI